MHASFSCSIAGSELHKRGPLLLNLQPPYDQRSPMPLAVPKATSVYSDGLISVDTYSKRVHCPKHWTNQITSPQLVCNI
jgi:hypothetical protein